MAPLQLRLEPTEVVLATDKELRLMAWVVSAAKTPLGVAAPPITTTAKSCPLQHPPPSGVFQISTESQ
eukprot:scaffold13821_cov132-Isochrysis_galbana.AAC.2